MATIKIPDYMHPFECDLNGKHYGPYAPGTTQDVPDEVAALIRDNAKLAPVENPPETVEQQIVRISEAAAYNASKSVYIDFGNKDLSSLVDVTSIVSTNLFSRLKNGDVAVKTYFKWKAGDVTLGSEAFQAITNGDVFVMALDIDSDAPIGVSYLRLTKVGSTIKAIAATVPFDTTE